MPVKFELKIGQVGKSLKVTIPVEIKRHLNLEKGDLVEMYVNNSTIMIEKKD